MSARQQLQGQVVVARLAAVRVLVPMAARTGQEKAGTKAAAEAAVEGAAAAAVAEAIGAATNAGSIVISTELLIVL